jgi:hypothetical protein
MSPLHLNQSTSGAGKMGLALLRQHHVADFHPAEHDGLSSPEEDEALAVAK